MRDNKNIDRLFQENLKDFEVFPPNRIWGKIEKNLPSNSRKNRFPRWFKIASAAAVLLLLFSVSTIYLLPKDSLVITFFSKTPEKEPIIANKDNIELDNKNVVVQKTEKKNKKKLLKNILDAKIKINDIEKLADNTIEKTNINKKSLSQHQLSDTKNLPFTKTIDNVIKRNLKTSKFTVATIYAPIYLNSFGDGSGISSQFGDSPISGNNSYSYGVKLAYQLSNKFSVQSGVNLISMGYTTNNVYISPGVSSIGYADLSSNPFEGPSSLKDTKGVNLSSKTENNIGSLNQVFGYIEIPIELKYNVANGKFGVNLVGGFSTLLLNRDEVYVETNSFTQSLGESNNLRSINFSGNIGIDVDYSIKKNLYLNISPMFKVQTNTFSKNTGSVLPYYLGVYTGLNYKF